MNETMTLKLELAKERGLNEALQEEIHHMKEQFMSEIHLLEETIQMQNEGTRVRLAKTRHFNFSITFYYGDKTVPPPPGFESDK